MTLCHGDQRCFRGVADLLAVRDLSIAAQNRRIQELACDGIVKLDCAVFQHDPVSKALLNSHFILCQCAGFIRTDDRNTAQALYGLQLSNNSMLPNHFLRTERQHDGHNRAERLRNSGHGQRHSEQERIHDLAATQHV